MNQKYSLEQEKFMLLNAALSDRVLRAEFRQKFGWMPSFAAFRKKRQRLGIEKDLAGKLLE